MLLKWYVPERGSFTFQEFLRDIDVVVVSRLTVVEMRCALARKRRARALDQVAERSVLDLFARDIELGHIQLVSMFDQHLDEAAKLISRLESISLRSLDALHLAIARSLNDVVLATADRIMAEAARALDLPVVLIGVD